MEVTQIQNLTRDMIHTFVATSIMSILRVAQGYIYVKLEGIDPRELEKRLAPLANEGDLKTQVERGGLSIVFAKKK